MGRQSAGRTERFYGMIGPVEVSGAINEIYCFFLRHCGIVTGGKTIGNYWVNDSMKNKEQFSFCCMLLFANTRVSMTAKFG